MDGFVRAAREIAAKGPKATPRIRPFRRLTAAEQDEPAVEGAALSTFVAVHAQTHDVAVEAPTPG